MLLVQVTYQMFGVLQYSLSLANQHVCAYITTYRACLYVTHEFFVLINNHTQEITICYEYSGFIGKQNNPYKQN